MILPSRWRITLFRATVLPRRTASYAPTEQPALNQRMPIEMIRPETVEECHSRTGFLVTRYVLSLRQHGHLETDGDQTFHFRLLP